MEPEQRQLGSLEYHDEYTGEELWRVTQSFPQAGRRSVGPAAQDDLTVVGTPMDETSRYGLIGGAVGGQMWRDDVSHIIEADVETAQSVTPRATVPRATPPAPAPAPAPARRSTNVTNWHGDAALGQKRGKA